MPEDEALINERIKQQALQDLEFNTNSFLELLEIMIGLVEQANRDDSRIDHLKLQSAVLSLQGLNDFLETNYKLLKGLNQLQKRGTVVLLKKIKEKLPSVKIKTPGSNKLQNDWNEEVAVLEQWNDSIIILFEKEL